MSREERYQEELEQRIMKHGKKLRGLFNRSNARILAEINDLYARFAESGEELVSLIYNASRLDLILGSIRTILNELGQEEEQELRQAWGEEYKRSILHHLYFIEQDFQVGVTIPQINPGMILAAVERPWEGRHFSKRIRMRTDLLAAAMEDVITQAVVQGWGVSRTAKEITLRTSESWSSALRLARTETRVREFKGVDDLNRQAREWLNQVANVRIHGTTHVRPVDRWQEEKLKPMNPTPFAVVDRHARKVSADCLVSFEANRYSVPFRFMGHIVHVQDDKNGRIRIYSGDTLIAEHPKALQKGQMVINKKHFEGLRPTGQHRAYSPMPKLVDRPAPEVHERDLSVYEQFLDEAVRLQ
jgi:hypothetical protein